MPNPSTMTSDLEEHYQRELALSENLSLPKANREFHLGEARRLAAQLGIEGPPPINHRDPGDKVVFTVHLTDVERRVILRALFGFNYLRIAMGSMTADEIRDLYQRIEGGE